MAKILNFGSINIDHVYQVEYFVRPGETQTCKNYQRFAGGKGLNQSIALANAGANVFHAGKLNAADNWLKTLLIDKGVNIEYVEMSDQPTGHAIIQVNAAGENTIVIVGGANEGITQDDIHRVLANFGQGDYLLVQNEVSGVDEILITARSRNLTTIFNPAPMTSRVFSYPLELVDILIVNETEACTLTQVTEIDAIAQNIRQRFPKTTLILTMGKQGAHYFSPTAQYYQPALPVTAIDTTAAGDTFIGFFLASLIENQDPCCALQMASKAASLCVTRTGAANSIPLRSELDSLT